MKKVIKYMTLAIMLCLTMAIAMHIGTTTVYAEDIASGTSGTCTWVIDENGVLTISPTDGVSGTLRAWNPSASTQSMNSPPWRSYATSVLKVVVEPGVSTSVMRNFFSGMSKVTEIDISNLNTSAVTSMRGMFNGCSSLTTLNVSGLDTSNVTDFGWMFTNCQSLTSVDLSSWNTSNVTDMSYMFGTNYIRDTCGVRTVNTTGWDTSSVTTMERMFERSYYLQKVIGIENWDVSNVTTMMGMFRQCNRSLTSLNLSQWSPSSCTSMAYMFDSCTSLTTIGNVSNWNVPCLTTASSMFVNCNKLKSLDASNWTTRDLQYVSNMFKSCWVMTSFDASNWNTSNLTTMASMFEECQALTSVKFADWDTSNVTNMTRVFWNCLVLPKADISGWDTSSVTNFDGMFMSNNRLLKTVVLGEDFNPKGNEATNVALLHTPTGGSYTGKWIRDDGFGPYTPQEIADYYDDTYAGTWIWEERVPSYDIQFNGGDDSTGSMLNIDDILIGNEYHLPKNRFVKYGYNFDHWEDNYGHSYEDEAVIPANTYADGAVVIFTAVYGDRDRSIHMNNGEFTFTLRGGERATFEDIPAGTSYQVYELTEDGWVLVQQENTAGIIEALETSVAQFYNKYMPGITTVQFSGTKTLDSRPVQEEGRFGFELWEGEDLIETVYNSEGGFIQFSPIEFKDEDVGEHTFTIKEILDEYDIDIEYDKHEETIIVTVELIDGKITNTVEYDDDGVKFENMTRPGSLKLTKYSNGVDTDANADDEFTFEITFRNESGMLVNDSIYWYIEGEATGTTDEEPPVPTEPAERGKIGD